MDTPKSKRQLFEDNIKAKHPDFDNEDSIYDYATENYNNKKESLNALQSASESVLNVMDSNPQVANMIELLSKYPNRPDLALKQFPKDLLEKAIDEYDDEEEEEDLNNSMKQYRQQIDKDTKRQQRAEENLSKSNEIIDKVASEMGINSEDIVGKMNDFLQNIADGVVSEEVARTFAKGLTADNKIETAKKEGETLGKNSKIEQITKQRPTDGLPNGTASAPLEETTKEPTDDFDYTGSWEDAYKNENQNKKRK